MDNYKISSFVTEYRKEGIVALHNHLNRKTGYLTDTDYQNLSSLLSKTDNEMMSRFNTGNPGEKDHKTIKMLIEKAILVPKKKNEVEVYQQWIERLRKQARPYISVLYIFPTMKCNFSCRYCVIENNLQPEQQNLAIDPQLARKGIDLFFNNSNPKYPRNIIFYGGEPLLCEDLVLELIEYIEEKSRNEKYDLKLLQIAINTNISVLTEKAARFFGARDYISLGVSLDGMPDDNDKMRVYHDGSGTFHDIEKGIRLAQQHNVKFGFSFTVGNHNIANLHENVQYLMEHFNAPGIGFNIMHLFEDGDNPGDHDVNEVIKKIQNVGLDLLHQHKILEDKTFYRRWKIFHDQQNNSGYFRDCAGMGEQIVLSPSGKIGPCHAMIGSEKYYIEFNDPQMDLLQHPHWKKWANCSPVFIEKCLSERCLEIDMCGGGCPYEAEITNGNLHHPMEKYCQFVKKLKEMYVWEKFDRLKQAALAKSGTPALEKSAIS